MSLLLLPLLLLPLLQLLLVCRKNHLTFWWSMGLREALVIVEELSPPLLRQVSGALIKHVQQVEGIRMHAGKHRLLDGHM